eukprot:TRINITY_DN2332_c0_g2_i7.p1 TRINITY_DN2332_c0_g2~~TRINITY_DN2332_c0_g2_i7.p1  ORF type:complete len:190 (-),score=71.13 TRINITY_DN2332_c0_g2_i7:87-587(-)
MAQSLATADLCDEHEKSVMLADSIFQSFGGKKAFHGEIVTLRVHNDNSLVKQAVESNGEGKVLVVDGSGSIKYSLFGDNLAKAAVANKWAGIVVNGAIRDTKIINTLPLGMRALTTCPRKTLKKNIGEKNVPVSFANCLFIPGQFIYVDEDGIIVSPKPLHIRSRL